MVHITGTVLAMLLIPAGAFGAPSDFPADLSGWLVTQPPDVGDERWIAANNDTKHEWVVFLRGDRPSARLRSVKREKGSPYPERQESYPPMPFRVPRGSAKDGLAGEWFSAWVPDGWLIGFNAGEFGVGLWWFSPDGKTRYKVSGDQVSGFFQTGGGLLALEGIAHGVTSRGRIIRLNKGPDGLWRSAAFVDLGGSPESAVLDPGGTLTVATHDRLVRVHVETRALDVLLTNAF